MKRRDSLGGFRSQNRAKKKVLFEIDSVRVELYRNHCSRPLTECSMTEIYSMYRYTVQVQKSSNSRALDRK